MYPILFKTPWFNIYSYGFMLSLGYAVTVALAMYKAKKNGLDTGTIFDLMMILLVIGIFGSRLFFILEYAPQKLFTKDILAFEQGGLTFYGSIVIGLLFIFIFSKIKKISFWKIMDCIGLGMGPAIAIARVGCFLNGCCYGTACSPTIGFRTRFAKEGYYHATQLYESFYSILAFIIILIIIKKYQTHYGQVFLSFISIYGFFRFFIEFIRVENPAILLGMTLSQIISIILIILSIIIWKINKNNKSLELQ